MLPGFSIHSWLPAHHTSNSNPHSLFLPILAFFSFLNRRIVPISGFALAVLFCLNSSYSRAFQGLFLLFVQIIDQIISERASLAMLWGNILLPLNHTRYLGTLSHYCAFHCFKPTSFITLWISPIICLLSPQNVSFVRARTYPSCLWQSLCTSPSK